MHSDVQQPSRHLWLGNINTQTITVEELRRIFEQFGSIENINILYEKNCVFIDYYDESSAVDAQSRMKGMVLGGNIIELGFGKYEEKQIVGVSFLNEGQMNNCILLQPEDSENILLVFLSKIWRVECTVDVMNKLRNREHVSLNEVYSKIISSPEFSSRRVPSEETNEKVNPALITKQNLEFLRENLLQYATTYIIQEDRLCFWREIMISI